LVKRIDVLYDSENREHHLTLTMSLPIVNDGIKKLRSGREGREYEVTPGTETITLVSKKRRARVELSTPENYSLAEPVCHGGVGWFSGFI